MFNSIRRNKTKTYWTVGLVFAFVTAVFYFVLYYFDFGSAAIPIAVIISVCTSWGSYYFSDKIILMVTGARPADDATDKKVKNAMEGLIVATGLPMPKVYVMDDSSLNAFATGRNPKHAVVCVTQGLVDKLDYYQLEGVLAHELAHIKNYDILLSTVVTVMVGAVVMLSHMFSRMAMRGRGKKNEGNGVIMIIGLVFMILAPIFGQLLKMALSRSREYLADATAVEFTRNPEGLASALLAIGADSAVEAADPATASMFIASPVANPVASSAASSATSPTANAGGHAGGWFATHPPIDKRVEAIRGITA